ncbi:hypothetical protein [Sulfurirhabdus autotrophica]|nr:hypothetical protein [Sulfurirhabdus autotrophica]
MLIKAAKVLGVLVLFGRLVFDKRFKAKWDADLKEARELTQHAADIAQTGGLAGKEFDRI